MVISAPRGMIRGTGTVDGVAGYGFLVSGFDGQGSGVDDRVRVKVWHLATGAVVYDNQPGAPDDAGPTTPIGAGNIIIVGASNGLVGPSAVAGDAPVLTESQLPALVAEALARWRAAGAAVDGLAGLPVRVADLPGGTLGLATPGGIWIDLDAAGLGWFVDPTPADDSEFRLPGDQGEAGLADLLTVLLHEFGHLLGHDHADDGLMGEALAPGTRLIPDHDHPARHEEEAPPIHAPTPPPTAERREDLPPPTVPDATPVTTLRYTDPFAVSIAPGWLPEPTATVLPPPAAKAAVRPPADDESEAPPSAPRETGEETPESAEWVGPEVSGWIDWPDEWWGVPLEPERS
jgi:hypothetical protein